MPKISVALATYNGEQYIAEQLASILSQLKENDEVIISDNNSTDKTISIIKDFNDKRIRIYLCSKKSVISNFENALNNVSGDIIFLSDQDDVWLENKVSTVLKYLQTYDLVMTDSIIADENLQTINASFYNIKKAGKGVIKNLISNTYQGSNMAFKKKILGVALPFPKSIPMHDSWLGLVGEYFFSVYFIPEKLSLYRRHSTNASTSTVKSKFSIGKQIQHRFALFFSIFFIAKKRNKTR